MPYWVAGRKILSKLWPNRLVITLGPGARTSMERGLPGSLRQRECCNGMRNGLILVDGTKGEPIAKLVLDLLHCQSGLQLAQ